MTEDKLEKKIRKKRILTSVSILVIIIIGFMVLALKSSYFNISNVSVENVSIVSKDEIQVLSEALGKNIFLINKDKMISKIKSNPYVDSADIKRKLPASIMIDVKEKQIKGIYHHKDTYINIDKEGRMVHAVNKFPSGRLPLIEGVEVGEYVPNQSLIKDDDIKLKALKEILCIGDYNETKGMFESINISDPYSIVLKTKEGIIVKIGDSSNLEYKLESVVGCLNSPQVKGSKGILEIEPEGTAVFRKQ